MPYMLKDRLFVSIQFNGREMPFDVNALDYVHISSSVRTFLPILTFKITDIQKFLTLNNFLVDGTRITITVGKNQQKAGYNFRLFSFQEMPSASPSYVIRAYLDHPLYWTSSITEIQRGTTNKVLEEIARRCGMTYQGVNTSDVQAWIPQNLKLAEYARRLRDRGWINDSSCMQLGVTVGGTMRYRNVSDFATYPVLDYFATTKITDRVKPMTDYKIVNKAGFFNVSSGYGERRISQSVDREDEDYSKLSLRKNSAKLMMNTSVQGAITQNKVAFAPINVGNVHANYERALYQNRRMASFFGLGMELMTPSFTEADLMDVVSVEVETPEIKGNRQYSGKYLVTSKVIYTQGANYYEKIELARHGLNEPREDTQV